MAEPQTKPTDIDELISRALTNMTISTVKACIATVAGCSTRHKAIHELHRWLRELEKPMAQDEEDDKDAVQPSN